jgi:hypothetical protein
MNAEEKNRKLVGAVEQAVKEAFEQFVVPYFDARLAALEARKICHTTPEQTPILYRRSLTEM